MVRIRRCHCCGLVLEPGCKELRSRRLPSAAKINKKKEKRNQGMPGLVEGFHWPAEF